MEEELFGTDLNDSEANAALTPGSFTLFGYTFQWYVWLLSFAAIAVLLILLFKAFKPKK